MVIFVVENVVYFVFVIKGTSTILFWRDGILFVVFVIAFNFYEFCFLFSILYSI